ncbi:MAG TPA: hypothetical protein VMU77_08120, partial [Acidimicrobiales bacterium]|nr:hypothetical protein [Acidimicrobiales bacterium]
MPSQSVELTGHILDSLTLPKILDLIISSSCDYEIIGLHLGHTNRDSSNVSIRVTAPSQHLLDAVLSTIRSHGAIIPTRPEAVLVECIQHGVLPDEFYSSTNLPTKILVGGHWIQISYPEMDCAILFDPRTESARCVPIHAVRIGDLVVTGTNGIEIEAPSKGRNRSIFEFMGS